jgi:Tfp pilus assembly protein PilF
MKAMRLRLTLPVLVSVLFAGCAGTPVQESPAEVPAEVPAPGAAAKVTLPDVAFNPQTVYDILLGEIALQRGHAGVASVTLGKVAHDTRDPRIAERATYASIYARRFEDALRSARLWSELQPDDTDAREAVAAVLLELGRGDEARVEFERLIALDAAQNNVDQAYMRVAAILSRQTSRDGVLDIMERLVTIHPESAVAHFALAHLSVRLGDLDRALAADDRALALRPDWDEAVLFKARILVSRKETSKAQQFYEAFLQRRSAATTVRTNYARFLVDLKQWEAARQQFMRVVADTPDDAESTYAVGLLSLQTNHPDEAETWMKRSLGLRPQNDHARLYLGQIAEERKDYVSASRWYGEVQPGEQYFEAQARLGIVIAHQGDLAKARAHLQALNAETGVQRIQRVLFEEQILRDARQYREALGVLNRALEAMPSEKELLYARALVAEKLDMIDVLESDLRNVIKQDPKHAQALNALGYTLADRTTRFAEAQELLAQALAIKPDDAYILDSMGWLQFRLGNNTESVKFLKRALEIRSDAEISAHLGEVLWVMGNRKEAESVWDRALHDTPDNEALLGVINKFREKNPR